MCGFHDDGQENKGKRDWANLSSLAGKLAFKGGFLALFGFLSLFLIVKFVEHDTCCMTRWKMDGGEETEWNMG